MNNRTTYVLIAILAAAGTGFTSPAFADVPISISADSDVYDHSSTIVITGQVSNVRSGVPVTMTVVGSNGNLVTIDQINVNSDGSFSTEISTSGSLMKYDGAYTIKVTYGSSSVTDKVTVELTGGEALRTPSTTTMAPAVEKKHYEIVDLMSEVNYNINGGDVTSITASTHENALVIGIDTMDDGEITVTLSEDVITALPDGSFVVLVDNEQSDDAMQNGNKMTIPFDYGTQEIVIIGSHVVPEFGTIAAMILAVAIVSIIVVSAKTRLSIMPKY